MTLQAQIYSMVERIAEKFSGVDARIGGLNRLDTTAKTDLVAAINELAARSAPSGTGVAFVHQQWVPGAIWTVNHNLGLRPTVSILDAGGNEVEADVVHTSANQLLIRFAIPVAGLARLKLLLQLQPMLVAIGRVRHPGTFWPTPRCPT